LRNKYAATVYGGIVKHKSLLKIQKELYDMTINSKVKSQVLLNFAYNIAKKAKKIEAVTESKLLSLAVFDLFNKKKYLDNTNKIVNVELRNTEAKDKKQYLQDLLSGASIFFIASEHEDSAEDHRPYQGKIYVDRYWWQKTHDDKVRQYINKNKIRTVQWVTGSPVWFITRPHCRHYFKKATVRQILTGDYTVPHRLIGDKEMQTPAQATLEYYQERLKLLEAMYEVSKNPKIRDMILKTEMLIKKYLKK